MDKLKPCPFCGKPVSIYYSPATKGYYALHDDAPHSNCIALIPISIDYNRTLSRTAACKAWNRRVNDEQ